MTDVLLHAVVGFGLYLAPALVAPGFLRWPLVLACGLTAASAGLAREVLQHRDELPTKPPDLYYFEVWGPEDVLALLTPHRVLEGVAWGVGAALAGLL